MVGGVEVLCGVLIFRAVTAPNVAASQTKPKVDPTVTHFEALFAPLRSIRLNIFWRLG